MSRRKIARLAEDRPAFVDYSYSLFNLELTNRCPFRCVMCPRTHHMTRTLGLMDFELFQTVVDQLVTRDARSKKRDHSVWLHHFGESLVHPELGRFLDYAKRRGLGTRISINPLMLSKKVIGVLLDGEPMELLISLDGSDDESFERIRGVAAAYEKSRENLLRFLSAKIARKAKTRITLSVIAFPLNERTEASQREEWADQWARTPGIDEFLWKPFTTWNGDSQVIPGLAPKGSGDVAGDLRARDPGLKVSCDWPWKKMSVTWNGDVVPCCYDYNGLYVLGNVKRESLAEIWNGERMQALRSEFISNAVSNPLCASCSELYA